MARKHTIPAFLIGIVATETYEKWLHRRAQAHVKRDRKRGHLKASQSLYKEAINAAVHASNGKDAYTGEALRWDLISTFDNKKSQKGRHEYMAGFALLPTIDHVTAGATEASFKICSWQINDAKSGLSLDLFLKLCIRLLKHAGYSVRKRA